MSQPPHIDAISFIAGFLAASLFWWIFSKVKGSIPQLRANLQQRIEAARERNREGISIYIREETLRRAQNAHLTRQLFPLDEILIQPRLLAPPGYVDEDPGEMTAEGIAAMAVPYMPDWPQLSAPYPVPTLTLAEALSNGSNIAVIGQPGSGKTVALAQLAALIARKHPDAGPFVSYIPFFFHALDLDLAAAGEQTPTESFVKLVSGQVPVLLHSRLPKYLQEICSSGKVILLVDGLDELMPAQVDQVIAYLKRLHIDYPGLRMAVTASSGYIDSAGELELFPLVVAAWSQAETRQFIRNFGERWSDKIMPEASRRATVEPIETGMVSDWLESEPICLTPLEWTLKLWSVYSGDLSGPSAPAAIQAYIDRLSQKIVPLEALHGLAWQFYCEDRTSLNYEQVDQFFSKYDTAGIEAAAGETNEPREKPKKATAKITQKISSGSRVTQALAARGLLAEHANGQVRFAHPVIGGFLASFAADPQALRPIQHPLADLHESTLHYLAAQNKLTPWLKETLQLDEGPLYQNILAVCRWLKDTPRNAEWRTPVMRKLVALTQNEAVPTGVRARIIAAFYTFNDNNVPLLFKQMLLSGVPVIRQVAALGIGASQDQKSLDELLCLFTDPVQEVRFAACLAIGAIDDRVAFNALVETLKSGEEDLQDAAAESLARTPAGQEALKEAVQDSNLMVRRAAISGLAYVREEWARNTLEHISIEDGQWVIRSAANQAIELMRSHKTGIPKPLPPTHQSPWLITFASQQGEGISPGQDVTDQLLVALKTGSPEERLGALQYLRNVHDEGAIAGIYEAYYTGYGHIHDAALFALWYLSISGAELPPPAKYGYFA